MFSPFLNGLGSTIDGMPWLCSMSPAQWAIPLRTLPPPVSKKRFSAVGLVTKKLVGAMASRNKAGREAHPLGLHALQAEIVDEDVEL